MQASKDQILEIVRNKGPILPIHLAKELNIDTFFAGAMLSDLVSSHKLAISSLKVGGSPLYYLEEQKSRLQEYSHRLNEKDQRSYELLKESKVLQDSELTALLRVSMRAIKDFAIPLQVNYGEHKLLFWKWYLLSMEDAEVIIKAKLGSRKEAISEQAVASEEYPFQTETVASVPKSVPAKELDRAPEKQVQETLAREAVPVKGEKQSKTLDSEDFIGRVTHYFAQKQIEVLAQEVIKKKTEIDFEIMVPSNIGRIKYYCKARKKSRINEADLSSAFVQGQLKKLPVLFLTTGDLTKKASGMLSKEFNTLTFVKV